MTVPITPGMIRVAMRWRKDQEAPLRELAERAKIRDLAAGAVSSFEGAADAAKLQEPLLVVAEGEVELATMIQVYSDCGVRPAAVDRLAVENVGKPDSRHQA